MYCSTYSRDHIISIETQSEFKTAFPLLAANNNNTKRRICAAFKTLWCFANQLSIMDPILRNPNDINQQLFSDNDYRCHTYATIHTLRKKQILIMYIVQYVPYKCKESWFEGTVVPKIIHT